MKLLILKRRNGLFLAFSVAFAMFFFGSEQLQAQLATNSCFSIHVNSVNGQPGETVEVAITIDGFDKIVSMQYALRWNVNALTFAGIDIDSSQIPFVEASTFGTVQVSVGYLPVAWYDPFAQGLQLPDSTLMFKCKFTINQNAAPGVYFITVDKLLGNIFEVYDADGKSHRSNYQPGRVYVGNPSLNDLSWTNGCTHLATCSANNGSVSLDVAGGQPPYNFAWSGPNGFNATTPELMNVQGGIYTVVITDGSGNSVTGSFDLTGPQIFFQINVATETAICGTATGCAIASVGGGAGTPPYTYAWSGGTAVGETNCTLLPGSHTVTVTDNIGCARTKNFTVGNDTIFDVSTSVTQYNCKTGQTGEISVSALNPDFTGLAYQWSNGDTAETVSGLVPGSYSVTVTHSGGCSAERSFSISDQGTQFWSTFAGWDCPVTDTEGMLQLTYNPFGGLTFPVTLEWNTGTVRYFETQPPLNGTSLLDSLPGLPIGQYSVIVTDSSGCQRNIQSTNTCFPKPDFTPSTWVYVAENQINGLPVADNCIGVYGMHFKDVSALQFTLSWDPSLMSYDVLDQFKLPGYDPTDLINQQNTLVFSWENPGGTGLTLPDSSLIFAACFNPIPGVSQAQLNFVAGNVTPHILNGLGKNIGFVGRNGGIRFGNFFNPTQVACDFGIEPGSCSLDGNGRIFVQPCNPNPYTITYVHQGKTQSTTAGSLPRASAGGYDLRITQGLVITQAFAYVPPKSDTTACVWPGDADNNNAVNHHDLLYLGVAVGANGPQRPNADVNWTGQAGPNWAQQAGWANVNLKNIDTDGNGKIDMKDTVAIAQNWGNVIDWYKDDPFAMAAPGTDNGAMLSITTSTDTLAPGATTEITILLGNDDLPAENLHGLAFCFTYDPFYFEPASSYVPSNSWLGNPASNLATMQRLFPAEGRLDLATTRSVVTGADGFGAIGKLQLTVKEAAFAGLGDTVIHTPIYFRRINAVDPAGMPVSVGGQAGEIVIKHKSSGTSDFGIGAKISLAPNPASGNFQLKSSQINLQRIELINASGATVLAQSATGYSTVVPVEGLPVGIYWVRIYTDEGVGVKRVMVGW